MTWKKSANTKGTKSTDSAGGESKGQIPSPNRQIEEKYLTHEEILEIAAEREAANLLITKNESNADSKSISNETDR